MPNLEDLFKERIIDKGPNQGKTAEEAYAIRDSKARDISSSNPFINAVAASGGGPVKLFDVIGQLNKRRKGSVLLSEKPAEVEQMGLKQFAISGRPYIYGGDIFRITNQRTRTLTLMNRAAEKGVSGGIDDKIGNAVGNYASDAITNLLSGKKELPPKPDLVAFGTELAIDVADRTLGALLPNPMVPTKVAQEFEKGYDKKKQYFQNEFDTPKKIIELNNKNKVPGFLKNLLKDNKNALSQTKDFLISAGAGIVGGLVKAGVTALVRGGISLIVGKKMGDILLGPSKKTKKASSNDIWGRFIKHSSSDPYSKLEATYKLTDVRDRGDLSTYLILRNEAYMTALMNAGVISMDIGNSFLALNGTAPNDYSLTKDTIDKNSRFVQRGMSSKADFLNKNLNATYQGTEVIDATDPTGKKTYDDYDFIPLKFYSIFQNQTVQFRCTVTELSETFSPTWDTNKFIGNPFNFYTYQGVERSLTFSFKVFSLNLLEHRMAWQRLSFLAGLTYPQGFNGGSGAVAPPLIKFTLGDMYNKKDAFIDSLNFNIDANTPWEVGMNQQLGGDISPTVGGGFTYPVFTGVTAEDFKLPMIINVEVTLKFVESRQTAGPLVAKYGYK
jgi:hypothetical protein